MTTPNTGSPRWAPDPSGRFAQRWWNGERWTDYVAGTRGGPATTDRLSAADEVEQGPGSVVPAATSDDGQGLAPATDGVTWAASTQSSASSDGAPGGQEIESLAANHPPAQWAPDPSGRYAQRYWDGAGWTDAVAGPGGGAPSRDPLRDDEVALPALGTTQTSPAREPTPDTAAGAAQWAPDPSGRHAQRYWDGNRWTPFVAEADGGVPSQDPLDPDQRWPAPQEAATAAGPLGAAAIGSPSGDEALRQNEDPALGSAGVRQRQRRRRTTAAVVGAAGLAGVAVALALSGRLGSSDRANRQQPIRAAHHAAAVQRVPKRVSVGAASATTSPEATSTAAKLVDPTFDPCGLLGESDIAKATGLTVGSAQRISNGCAWRGTSALSGPASAQDRVVLHAQEGVILDFVPASEPPRSVLCTASIPGITTPSGVCTSADGSQYAMYQYHAVTVRIFVRTNHPVSQAQLEQLAQLAFSHTRA